MEVFRGLKVRGGRSGSIQRTEGVGWQEWNLFRDLKVRDGKNGSIHWSEERRWWTDHLDIITQCVLLL